MSRTLTVLLGAVAILAAASAADGYFVFRQGFNAGAPGDPVTDFGYELVSGPGGLKVDANEIFPGQGNSLAGASGPSLYTQSLTTDGFGIPTDCLCGLAWFSVSMHGGGLSTAGLNFVGTTRHSGEGENFVVTLAVSDRDGGTIRFGDEVAEGVGPGPWFLDIHASFSYLAWSKDGISYEGDIFRDIDFTDFSNYLATVNSIEIWVDGLGDYEKARFDSLWFVAPPEPATVSIMAVGLLAIGRRRTRSANIRVA